MLIWLREHCPEIIRGQLSGDLFSGDSEENPLALFAVQNLLTNIAAQPDFVAYDYHRRGNLSVKLCRLIYKVQEVSWTVRDAETAAALENCGNLIIFENFGW